MKTKKEVLEMVTEERIRQDAKWGFPQNNDTFEWISILGEEFGKLARATNDAYLGISSTGDISKINKYAIQVAAVALAIAEHLPVEEEKTDEN